ncbi:MAG: GNAT family N-acetyltransferase [Butyrivibrio sp.]|nr:GNAT family N-acetyltransferase [Butyrivibrio sp.]
MINYVMLDKTIASAFTPLYQGDISTCLGAERFAYGAVKDGEPVGLFLSTIYQDMITLDWIYVREDCRGEELGSRMVKGGVRVLMEILGGELVSVCCEDGGMKRFFEKCGFYFREEQMFYSYRAKLSDIIKLPEIDVPEDTVFRLSELRAKEFKSLSLYFESLKDTEIPIDLPIRKSDYMEVPAVYIRNDMIRAVILLKKESDEEVSIAFAYAFNRDGRALATLIQEAVSAIRDSFGEDVIISTASLGKNTEKMLESLFVDIDKKPIYQGIFTAS